MLRIHARSLELRAAQLVDARILAGGALLRDVALPCREVIDPRLDGVFVTAELARRELRGETVVAAPLIAMRCHSRLAVTAEQDGAGDDVVTVREHVRRHAHGVAAHAFDREAAAIDLRRDVLDDDAGARHPAAFRREIQRRERRQP